MRILLDECVDWRLSRSIPGHDVKTARQMGWATVKNGELLALASGRFDLVITVDRNSISAEHSGIAACNHCRSRKNQPAC